ncbi:MAG: MBL fold metallo-hydrolase [Phycisphaerales bacterium]|nr:MBL fold metallo-hydrolase [Phycisphaerales bacterium]
MSGSRGDAPLRIKAYTLGPYATNCYVLWLEGGTDAWIVDASFDPGPIVRDVRELGLKPSRLLLTHAHVDHIAGVEEVLGTLRQPGSAAPALMIHTDESQWLVDPVLNLSAMGGVPVTTRPADGLLAHGQRIVLGDPSTGVEFEVLHTPGHSPGGVSFYSPSHGVVLAGDALFAGSIGRTDFPGGDLPTLERSIRERLYTLPRQTRVLAGHGPDTTVGDEMDTNPYVPA